MPNFFGNEIQTAAHIRFCMWFSGMHFFLWKYAKITIILISLK